MQTLHQELDPTPQGLTPTDHPVLQGLTQDQAARNVVEVNRLRQRVVDLEAELAAAKVSQAFELEPVRDMPPLTSIDLTPAAPAPVTAATPTPAPVAVSEFTVSDRPAVVPVANPGFAEAWSDEAGDSFEEQMAEKAFFKASAIDEESRSWLLDS